MSRVSATTTFSSTSAALSFSVAWLASAAERSAASAAGLADRVLCRLKPYSACSFSRVISRSSSLPLEEELRNPWPSEAAPTARPTLSAEVTWAVPLLTRSDSWRTSASLSCGKPAWATISWVNTWVLPNSFSSIADLLCSELSAATACKSASKASRLPLNASICSAPLTTGAMPCSRPTSSCSRCLIRDSMSPALVDWPIRALMPIRSRSSSTPLRSLRLLLSRSMPSSSVRVATNSS
ncbi:hypothetical protein D9M70_240420 [compost metagenome]